MPNMSDAEWRRAQTKLRPLLRKFKEEIEKRADAAEELFVRWRYPGSTGEMLCGLAGLLRQGDELAEELAAFGQELKKFDGVDEPRPSEKRSLLD